MVLVKGVQKKPCDQKVINHNYYNNIFQCIIFKNEKFTLNFIAFVYFHPINQSFILVFFPTQKKEFQIWVTFDFSSQFYKSLHIPIDPYYLKIVLNNSIKILTNNFNPFFRCSQYIYNFIPFVFLKHSIKLLLIVFGHVQLIFHLID